MFGATLHGFAHFVFEFFHVFFAGEILIIAEWAINIDGDFGLLAAENALFVSSSSYINGCAIIRGRVMKSGFCEWANFGVPRPEMTFRIDNDGVSLLNADIDGVGEFFHVMDVVGNWQGTGHWQHFADARNAEIGWATNDIGMSWEGKNKRVYDVAEKLGVI